MFEDYGVPGAGAPDPLIRVDLESVGRELPYLVVCILEIDGAVTILKSPHKWKAIGVAVTAFVAELRITGAVFAKDYSIVFFAAGDTRIERVERSVVIVESCLFIFPGCAREQIKVFSRHFFFRTAHRQGTRDIYQYGPFEKHPANFSIGRYQTCQV